MPPTKRFAWVDRTGVAPIARTTPDERAEIALEGGEPISRHGGKSPARFAPGRSAYSPGASATRASARGVTRLSSSRRRVRVRGCKVAPSVRLRTPRVQGFRGTWQILAQILHGRGVQHHDLRLEACRSAAGRPGWSSATTSRKRPRSAPRPIVRGDRARRPAERAANPRAAADTPAPGDSGLAERLGRAGCHDPERASRATAAA